MASQNNPSSLGIDWHLYDDGSGIIQPHEPLQEYVPGGLHTVTLGDIFHDGRYRIHNKLGYGGHSTVWQWVAIKIKKAHDSTDDLDKDPEIQTMRALEKHYVEGSQEKTRGFIQLFDWFRHEGPNGIHNCLVMELLGPSLETILRANVEMEEFLAPDTILRTSRQLLEAIKFVHQAGLVHGVEKLGPLPPAWNTRWDEMIAEEKKLEGKVYYDRDEQLITDTFEPRRQAIIQQCEEVDRVYQRDEYTDDDYEGLTCLLRPMVESMQYEPEKRVSLREALSYIDWVNHRVEMDEAGVDEAEKDEAGKDEAKKDEADSLGV
ncbi:hypothetical protein VF21_08775 [Pseudogymnoascus sp. 05NY08]|nr:hypothetical protein VF21_08775 [Pseudogymnoascus sp. 05NY08]